MYAAQALAALQQLDQVTIRPRRGDQRAEQPFRKRDRESYQGRFTVTNGASGKREPTNRDHL